MGFYGVINVLVRFGKVSENTKQEVINNIMEFLDLEYLEDEEVSFREENNFNWLFVDDLKSVLEELKANNKIVEAKIYVWYLEEPDETINI